MTEQAKAQVVDTDLPYYCAYSLPGVALTLGREHWSLIKPTFSLLAGDMQVRVEGSMLAVREGHFQLHSVEQSELFQMVCLTCVIFFQGYRLQFFSKIR